MSAQPVAVLHTVSPAFAEIRAGIERVDDEARRSELAHWLNFRVRKLFGEWVIDADETIWSAMLAILGRVRPANRTLP